MKLFADQDEPRQPGLLQFELEEWIDSSPFERLLGMRIEHAVEGQALLTLPFTVKLSNGGGVMHGGAMTTLADTAVAMAIKSVLPRGTVFATTGLTMEFKSPILEGDVRAYARVSGPEDRIFHGECELRGESNELYARFTSVFKVARRHEAKNAL